MKLPGNGSELDGLLILGLFKSEYLAIGLSSQGPPWRIIGLPDRPHELLYFSCCGPSIGFRILMKAWLMVIYVL